MATTTPDNIWTPDAGDQYALTQDLGANADSVQAALIRRGNAYKGSTAQRTAFSSAEDGVLWQDTDGIKMVWRRDGVNWVPAVWRWTGSLSQMNAFTAAPVGFHWYNTTDNMDYVRRGGAWVLVNPPAPITTGTVLAPTGTLPSIGGGAYGTTLSNIAIPTTLEAGEVLSVSEVGIGNGWGIVSQVNNVTGPLSDVKVNIRFVQIGSGQAQTLTLLWQKHKIA